HTSCLHFLVTFDKAIEICSPNGANILDGVSGKCDSQAARLRESFRDGNVRGLFSFAVQSSFASLKRVRDAGA
ncbi:MULTISPECIES: hypothetical protein, partial [unclassified Rhizobium]